ncbi:hypothetical protein [Variovorax sp. JS1663]|uniref:hypothetical protein n=1 Tax=Variovorax sp. JS1663 TaxID=1851577 RepID=UPI00186514E8|nr:hypothetical protein [Variovorax sp. JS1663]
MRDRDYQRREREFLDKLKSKGAFRAVATRQPARPNTLAAQAKIGARSNFMFARPSHESLRSTQAGETTRRRPAPCEASITESPSGRPQMQVPSALSSTMTTKRAIAQKTTFATEADLVASFVGKLQAGRSCYGSVEVVTEWDHRSGLVDVLARDCAGALVAFEAKLKNWRRAFMQAYRSTAYANRTYVLLPPTVAERAMQDREEFELRGVGLCAFDGKAIQILIEACEQEPLLKWVRARAHEHFDALLYECRPAPRSSGRRRGDLQAAAA